MLSKFHKTISECQQRTSGTQKSSPLSLKGDRKKYKRQKKKRERERETKKVGMGLRPRKGVLKREKFPNTRKHFLAESVASLGSTEGNITGRENK